MKRMIILLTIITVMCLSGCGSTALNVEDVNILDNLQKNNTSSASFDVWDNDIIFSPDLEIKSEYLSCLFDSKSLEEGSFVPRIGGTDTVGDYYQVYKNGDGSFLYSFAQAHETIVANSHSPRLQYLSPVSSYDGSIVIWGEFHQDGAKLYCYDSTKEEINTLYEAPFSGKPCYVLSPNGKIAVVCGRDVRNKFVSAMISNGKATDLFPDSTTEISTENGNSVIDMNETPLFAVAVDDSGNILLAEYRQGIYYSFFNGELKEVAKGQTFCMNRKHDEFIIKDNDGVSFYSFGWDKSKKNKCGEMGFLELFIPETMKYQTNYLSSLQGCRIYGVDNFDKFCFENADGDLIRIDDFDRGAISIFKKDSSLGGAYVYSACGMVGFNPYFAFSNDFTNMIYADTSGLYRLELTSASSVPELIYADDTGGESLESAFLYSNDQKHIIIANTDKIVSYDCDSHQSRIIAEGEVEISAISRQYGYMICGIDDTAYVVRDDGYMEELGDGYSLTCFQIDQEEEIVNVWSLYRSIMITVRGNVLFATASDEDDYLRIYRLDENVKAIKIADTTDW